MKTTQNLKPQETQFGFKWMDPELSSRHDGRVTSFKDGKWRVKRGCYPRLCSATVYHYYSTFKQAMMDRYSVASKSVLVLVEVGGTLVHDDDKSGSTKMRVVRVLGYQHRGYRRNNRIVKWYAMERAVERAKVPANGSRVHRFMTEQTASAYKDLSLPSNHPVDVCYREMLHSKWKPKGDLKPIPWKARRAMGANPKIKLPTIG